MPFPENGGGRIRIARLAAALAGRAEMSLYTRIASDDQAEDVPALSAEPQWTRVVAARPGRSGSPLLPSWARSQPRALIDEIRKSHAEHPFSAIVFSHAYGAPGLIGAIDVPLVAEEQNVESHYFTKALRQEPTKALQHSLDWLRMRALERRVWRSCALVNVVREEDAQVVRGFARRVLVVPNGVSCRSLPRTPPSARTGNRILFLGTMSYEPNIRAALFLANEVLPLVRDRVPDATLTIAGRNPHKRVKALASASVRVTGTVPSTSPLLAEHAACALALPFGGGTSLKVMEAFAAELTTVANDVSTRGFPIEPGVHYLAAESREDFSNALIRVLQHRSEFDAMAARARLVAEAHDWERLGETFADGVLSALPSGHGPV
jgi:glycosyltransferase involved in cell wall biosynthesis